MSNDHPVLVSRQEPAPVPASHAQTDLDVDLARANAIARATQAVPDGYRNQPGAVLLAMAWSEARDIDLLTTIQTVNFIHGRPVVDATMQRALAERAGHTVDIVSADSKSATVAVDGKQATYTWEDAQRAGLADKSNWKQNPEDMLVARATTRAMKRFAPAVMVGLHTPDEDLHQPTVTEQIQTAVETTSQPEPADTPLEASEGDATESVAVDRDVLMEYVRGAYKAADTAVAGDFRAWRDHQGYPARADRMSDPQLLACADWWERREA